MVTAKLKGIFKVKAKGRVYFYAWRGGPRIEAEFGTKEFIEEYLAARSPTANMDRSRMASWVTLYRASDAYTGLADSTKATWGPLLDAIKDHFGALPVRQFDRPQIRRDIKVWRDKWRATPRMADMAKQALSRVCSFIVEEGVITSNPCIGIANIYTTDRSDIIWTAEDLDALCKVSTPEIGWAARLASLSGLRQGDLLKLTWSRVSDLAIEVRTSKSGGKRTALIPMYPALREMLAIIPKRALTVLTNTSAESWKSGFGASWQAALKRAGLDKRGLHFHDLRGTAATNFYRANFTSREIADILGWSPDQVEGLLNRYVKRDELLLDRIRRMERHENENRKTDSKTGGAR